ncbi:MAG: Na/Pi cotransporter family protein [Treponemataceae bacterium]
MEIFITLLKLVGGLGVLLYGMNLMSDGIQKSAGEKMQRTMSVMAGNRFAGLLTGMLITMVIQSSGATTVMVITFVNAGLLSLVQSVGVIFGANIGTTITAWIVSLFGFSFNISAFALPILGSGFFVSKIKKRKFNHIGEALMGFGLLFVGLGTLSAVFSFDPEDLLWLIKLQNFGVFSIVIAYFIGIAVTALLHSSSAFTAIVITMSMQGLFTWEFAAAMCLGADLGSTIDAVLASASSTADGKRAALIHVFFNLFGNIIALICFKPFLDFIVFITPDVNIAIRIATLHTMFKLFSAIIFLPFVKQLVKLTTFIIKDKNENTVAVFKLKFPDGIDLLKTNATPFIIRAEKALKDMMVYMQKMFDIVMVNFDELGQDYIEKNQIEAKKFEAFLDNMHEQITQYLIKCENLPITEKQISHISTMVQVMDEIEDMSDNCYTASFLMARSIEKGYKYSPEAIEVLAPYFDLARQSMELIKVGINNFNFGLTQEQFIQASAIEDKIDSKRKELKKLSRKRIEDGSSVRAELLYIDMVRQIEKMGDNCFAIAKASVKK